MSSVATVLLRVYGVFVIGLQLFCLNICAF